MKKILGYLIIALIFAGCAIAGSIYLDEPWWTGFAIIGGIAAVISLAVLGISLASGEFDKDDEPDRRAQLRELLQKEVSLSYNDCGNPYEVILADSEEIDRIVEKIIDIVGEE